jgi:hypothetical protein
MNATKGLYVEPNNGYVPCEDGVIFRFPLPNVPTAGFAYFYIAPSSPGNITEIRTASGDNDEFIVLKIAVSDPPPSKFKIHVSLEVDLPQGQLVPVLVLPPDASNPYRILPSAASFSMKVLR